MEATGVEETGIVRVVKEGEIVEEPIKIVIGVNLPADSIWFWVEFACWGVICGTLFLDLKEALDWCVVCYGRNLNRPIKIKDKDGGDVFTEVDLERYVRDRS